MGEMGEMSEMSETSETSETSDLVATRGLRTWRLPLCVCKEQGRSHLCVEPPGEAAAS